MSLLTDQWKLLILKKFTTPFNLPPGTNAPFAPLLMRPWSYNSVINIEKKFRSVV